VHVSVVICTYNRAARLRTTLDSLRHQRAPTDLSWEVIVVDNNSRDDTRKTVETFAAGCPRPVRYLFEPRQGKSYALNRAIEASTADVLAFTDDDVLVGPGWVAALWNAFADPQVHGVAGRVEAAWSTPRPRWLAASGPYRLMQTIVEYDCGPEPRPVDTDRAPIGANMAYRRACFERHGPFRVDLGGGDLLRGEDTEFGRRLLRNGETILYAPAAVIVHPVEPHRLRKRYFRSWYYDYGRAQVRLHPFPPQTITIGGIPRYLFRELVEHAGTWLVARGAPRRFYHQVACWRILGTIVEAWRAARAGRAGRSDVRSRLQPGG
jgi:glycosyltransferase involved in cell wall biosynthesis